MFLALLIAAAAADEPTPPTLRLGDAARPTRYTAELRIVPAEEPFTGTIDIEIAAAQALPVLWLHAVDLDVKEAFAEAGGARHTARIVRGPELIGLVLTPPLPRGAARVHLAYEGRLSTRDARGAGRMKEGDDWYVATQFEPIEARRVFPCFDEPGFKAPWRLSLVVPRDAGAFSNAPPAGEPQVSGDFKTVRFAESRPLPSYAVAFAVGPWEAVDAGRSRGGAPLRILALRGQADRARVSATYPLPILSWFEDYFGLPYAYEKLDSIAVPFKGGAMENPGLITYGVGHLQKRPGEETLAWHRGTASIMAHEIAHLWFGDLVTMSWWNDTWLNEAFATWLAGKMVGDWKPAFGVLESRVHSRDGAMNVDSLASARKVRQPIESAHDVHNAFDGITYTKGGQILSMFERWVGPEIFRKGVHDYLAARPHGNGTAADFLGAISAAAGRDIGPAFSSFLDQPGVPLVQMDLVCAPQAAPVLKLRQERYRPVGSDIDPAATWQIPICVRWGASGKTGRACTLLAEKEGRLVLEGAPACPHWVVPNEDGAGYYRSLLDDGAIERLLANEAVNAKERIALVGDLDALVRANRIPYGRALALLPKMASDPSRHVVQSSIGLANHLRNLVPPSQDPAYARLLRQTYGAQARALGWSPRPGEDEETRTLRLSLLPLVAGRGGDRELAAEARTLAEAWRRDRKAVDAEIVDSVLRTAAYHGDAALFDAWLAAVRQEKERVERQRLFAALGSFRDPALARRGLELILGHELDIRETFVIVPWLMDDRQTRGLAYEFVKANFDTLVARLPRDSASGFAAYGAALCEEPAVSELESFFKERTSAYKGGPRRYAQSLESLKLCVALRRAQGPSAVEFLSAYAGT